MAPVDDELEIGNGLMVLTDRQVGVGLSDPECPIIRVFLQKFIEEGDGCLFLDGFSSNTLPGLV